MWTLIHKWHAHKNCVLWKGFMGWARMVFMTSYCTKDLNWPGGNFFLQDIHMGPPTTRNEESCAKASSKEQHVHAKLNNKISLWGHFWRFFFKNWGIGLKMELKCFRMRKKSLVPSASGETEIRLLACNEEKAEPYFVRWSHGTY